MLDKLAFPGLGLPAGKAESMRSQPAGMGFKHFYRRTASPAMYCAGSTAAVR
jgi:hypothetical protein